MLKSIMTTNNLSIAQLATATNVNYALLLKKSKQPIPGVAYDPEAMNYDAMLAALEKNEVDLSKIDFTAIAEKAVKTKVVKVANFEVGQRYYSRYHKANFTIVYKTTEYVCILEDESTQPKVLHYNTFIACGLKEPQLPEIKEVEMTPEVEVVEKEEKAKK